MYRYGSGWLIETGSMCKEMEYATQGKFMRPQANGFLYAIYDNNKFVYENSKLVNL